MTCALGVFFTRWVAVPADLTGKLAFASSFGREVAHSARSSCPLSAASAFECAVCKSSRLFFARAPLQEEGGAKTLRELYLPSSSSGQFDLMSSRLLHAPLLPIPPASISPS